MKTFTNTFSPKASPALIKNLLCHFSKNQHSLQDFILFDIETTGLSSSSSMCWLIGTLTLCGNTLKLTQYFADSPSDERDLLEHFFDILPPSACLVHFNGTAFDIPFLLERAKFLKCSLESTEKLKICDSIDIFKIIKSCHTLLNLTDYKQKTIERFLDFPRKDTLTGKKLITLYKKYVISKDITTEKLLLLHNSDDLCGLYEICSACTYRQLYENSFKAVQMEVNDTIGFNDAPLSELIFDIQTEVPFPKEIDYKKNDDYCKIFNNHIKLRVPIKNNRVRLFFTDYKNYFYLPETDCAIHKSVASYVDKTRRSPATKDNCYSWVNINTLKNTADIQRFAAAYILYMLT